MISDVMFYLLWFWLVFFLLFGIRTIMIRRRKKTHIEFKCLEHMRSLNKWDDEYYCWRCPTEGCEAEVDGDIRWVYEGVRPPR